jgi:hypothetical protein
MYTSRASWAYKMRSSELTLKSHNYLKNNNEGKGNRSQRLDRGDVGNDGQHNHHGLHDDGFVYGKKKAMILPQ